MQPVYNFFLLLYFYLTFLGIFLNNGGYLEQRDGISKHISTGNINSGIHMDLNGMYVCVFALKVSSCNYVDR